jgi:HlyD family secretion protein
MNLASLKKLFRGNGRRVLFFSAGAMILVAVVVAAVLASRAGRASGTGLYTVDKGTLSIVITEDGTLRAKESANVIADVEAQAKIVWIIDEGSRVSEGDKLVELDKTELETFQENLQLDLITLQTNYTGARQNLEKYLGIKLKQDADAGASADETAPAGGTEPADETEPADGTAATNELAALVTAAEQGNVENVKGEAEQQRLELVFNVEKARARLDKARAQQPAEEQRHLYSESELRDAQIAVEEAQMNLDSAQLALQVFTEYVHPQKVRELVANLEKARRTYEKQMAQEAKVARQLEKMELYAPSDGMVIYGTGRQDFRRSDGTQDIAVGANVYKGQVVITLPNVSEMQVEIKIHEVDFPKVAKGLPATIRVQASEREYTGSLAFLGVLAHERDGWRSEGVKVFDVVVDIDGTHRELRPGMTARVDLLVKQVPNVLLIPVEAVFVEPGRHGARYCYVKTPSGPEKRPVKLGESNNNLVIVTDGLARGEQVYQYDPTAKTD